MPAGTVPYQAGPDGGLRPYLWLELTGINGASGPVFGLVDSGADSTTLPVGYASLMGYAADDLELTKIRQVQGTINGWHAKMPSKASVVGVPGVEFEISPLFVQGLNVLWGRADFMATFDVTVRETAQELVLHWSE